MRRCIAGTVAALVVVVTALPVDAAPRSERSGRGSFTYHSYKNAAGTRKYMLYVPANVRPGMPLIVDLPGCSETAEVEARRSQFNRVAARFGTLVAYPEQDPDANGGRCWNWFLPEHQTRGGGEASIIAGITRTVMKRWRVDPRRVYVFGISAGAAMANVMAVAYPDLYAAVGIYAGCEYRGFPCLASAPVQPWQLSAQWAAEEMGKRLRAVPVFVVQGDADVLVPAENSVYIVQQWLEIAELAAGREQFVLPREPDALRFGRKPTPNGRRYTVMYWHASPNRVLAEMWLVHGMGHQWSNAQTSGDVQEDVTSYDAVLNDPDGPDVTTPAVKFFLSHPMR